MTGSQWNFNFWLASAGRGLPGGASGKEPSSQCRTVRVQSMGGEDSLEESMATHSHILAWRIPWTEKPGGLRSIGSQRVGS